jgi:hypothetical protein
MNNKRPVIPHNGKVSMRKETQSNQNTINNDKQNEPAKLSGYDTLFFMLKPLLLPVGLAIPILGSQGRDVSWLVIIFVVGLVASFMFWPSKHKPF